MYYSYVKAITADYIFLKKILQFFGFDYLNNNSVEIIEWGRIMISLV